MADVKIQVRDNGPLLIQGEIQVEDAEGGVFPASSKPVTALCRCGVSKNRPFCDGSHNDCGFESAERAPSE